MKQNKLTLQEIMVATIQQQLHRIDTLQKIMDNRPVCLAVIDVGRVSHKTSEFNKWLQLLHEFPKTASYVPSREIPIYQDERLTRFHQQMDAALFTITHKLAIISKYLELTHSLASAVTMALILRDVKKVGCHWLQSGDEAGPGEHWATGRIGGPEQ